MFEPIPVGDKKLEIGQRVYFVRKSELFKIPRHGVVVLIVPPRTMPSDVEGFSLLRFKAEYHQERGYDIKRDHVSYLVYCRPHIHWPNIDQMFLWQEGAYLGYDDRCIRGCPVKILQPEGGVQANPVSRQEPRPVETGLHGQQ